MFLDTFSWYTCLEAAEHPYVPLHEYIAGAWVASLGRDWPSSGKMGTGKIRERKFRRRSRVG